MDATQMIDMMNHQPFSPVEVHLNDGSRIRVEEPYQIATRRNSPACIIYDDNDQIRFVAYRNIAQIVTNMAQN